MQLKHNFYPIYQNRIRGRLGTILAVSINAGLLIILIADLFSSYSEVACIAFVFLLLFLCTYTIFPDTPRQLYKIRKKEVNFHAHFFCV